MFWTHPLRTCRQCAIDCRTRSLFSPTQPFKRPRRPVPRIGPSVNQYVGLVGASSGQAINGEWPAAFDRGDFGTRRHSRLRASTPGSCSCSQPPIQTLGLAGRQLSGVRRDEPVLASPRSQPEQRNRLTFRVNVSPSTVTGIEVSGQDQPFGQNAYSRTSQQTYRDVAGVAQDTWTIGNTKVNEFRFQYARRGLSYFYNTKIPGGSDPAVNIPGFAYFGREPYSYISASRNDTSSPTTSPGPSDGTIRSSAGTSTIFHSKRPSRSTTAAFTTSEASLLRKSRNLDSSIPPQTFCPISPAFRRFRPMGRGYRETTSKAWGAPATRSITSRLACSGRIPGACVTI